MRVLLGGFLKRGFTAERTEPREKSGEENKKE
jgi:hypothetical protein